MDRYRLSRCLPILWIVSLTGVAMAGEIRTVPLVGGPDDGPRNARVFREGDVEQAPISTIAELLGFTWRWDMTSQRLTCTKGDNQVVFAQDIPHCSVNGAVMPLPVAPARAAADLYLPVPTLAEVFGPFGTRSLRWSESGESLGLFDSPFTLLAVSCNAETTTTVLTLTLADSIAVDVAAFFPKVHIDLAGATVDTMSDIGATVCGIVDSLDAYQLESSVQIEATIAEPVDSPIVRVTEGGRRVSIVLNALGRGGPLPDSLLFGDYDDTIGTVVIDPGHGGKDPGAIGPSGVQEKDLTLAVALRLRDILKDKTNLKVYLTREKDEFIPLRQRTKFANDKDADVFVSIHADAIGGSEKRKKSVRGYKVYFLSHAKNEEDKLVAMRENAVVELEDAPEQANDLQSIITEMVGNEYLRESQDLSIMLVETFGKALTQMRKLHTGVGQANFYVLNGAFMPSVLIEMGFVSNPNEEQILTDQSFQGQLADAVHSAIVNFKKRYGGGQ
ncbi:MAG: hypothetical protein GF331_11545 [Chitinivibrionales bacterium]|nr:hypothetical protein [Chitinivibrionales bacterium]